MGYLEPVQLQIDMLFSMGEGYESEYVLYSLREYDTGDSSIIPLIDSWRTGSSGEIEESLTSMKNDTPKIYESLVENRNNAWVPIIEQYLENDTVEFIIVGLAHMYGPEGLLVQLQDRGYRIEQLHIK